MFMVRHRRILEHIVLKNVIFIDLSKIKIILDLPKPQKVKEIQAFMGHCGYYRRFVFMYAIIAKPIYSLIIVFEWTKECDEAFEKLKNGLVNALILRTLDWNKPFHVHIDTLKFVVGCVLAQLGEHNIDFLVSYAIRQLKSTERNCSTIEHEGLGMIFATKKFRH